MVWFPSWGASPNHIVKGGRALLLLEMSVTGSMSVLRVILLLNPNVWHGSESAVIPRKRVAINFVYQTRNIKQGLISRYPWP